MPSRSVRRRRHKRLASLRALPPALHAAEAARRLVGWRREAHRRARSLTAPAVWGLANDPQVRAAVAALDAAGELQADLDRVCAEAVAREAGRSLVRGSRPPADRARLCRPGRAETAGRG
jgi:hypothetical protein